MILAPFVGLTMVLTVSTGPVTDALVTPHMTLQQKSAAVQPLVRTATECIARSVAADPRYGREGDAINGELIVDSVTACVTPVREMMDAHDTYFGDGSGESFFMGPYLQVLPAAISKLLKTKAGVEPH
jgi:hypothetical protein